MIAIQSISAVSDSLLFENGNMIVGEVKGMTRGILEIDAEYGDENFKIEWEEIKEIYTESAFLVYARKRRYLGRIASLPNKKVQIYNQDTVFLVCDHDEIVYLNQIKQKFSDRFSATIEVGVNLAKAQNLRQLTTGITLGYKTDTWLAQGAFNSLRSIQDNAELIERNDGRVNYQYILAHDWYITALLSSLSNTEQKIDARANSQIAFGNFIYATNKAYWGVSAGINNNYEKFSNESSGQNSWEAVLGTDLNLYDISDIKLLLVTKSYLGLSGLSRFRTDLNFDFKYDFKFDLYLKMGISLNYDNQPAENASETDYIFKTSIGWEW